ncbi:restriction endonuclease subunit S [Salinispira pacifica]|uniref:Type I restriction-modification system, specificity subunit S n=1 Tax=Salinispira pacifica TaxID=1307761 RepID=V5WJL6_9SPIO|nr:restriction endonuclease subunit S [Salinispira pacifica]AHC16002.1 Type I restriction-modification system, specificity subunit S [Salinispira pacifica]
MAIELSEKQIKVGWQIVKFGEIAKEVKSTTKDPAEDGLEFYVGLEHLDPQSLRIARKGIIAEDNPSFTRRFSAGQILFGKRRCYQKKAAVADFEGICSCDIIVMDAIPKKIIPELLPFIIQSDAFFDWAEKTSSGSLSPRTKWKSLAEFEFPLPPIERQKEILEVLEKVEDNYGKNIRLVERINLFKEIISNKLLNDPISIYQDETVIECSLGDVLEKIVGGGTPRRTVTKYWNGKIPWVTVKDLKGVRLSASLESITEEGLNNSATNLIPEATPIVATRIGVGKAAIFDKPITINQDLKALFPKDVLLSEYLLYWLVSKESYFDSVGKGTTVKGINLELLRSTPFVLPSANAQKKSIDLLKSIEGIEQVTLKKLRQLLHTRRSYFSFAISGGVQ